MSKKKVTSGLDSILGQPKPIEKEEITKEKDFRATIVVNEEIWEKIKAVAYWDRKKMKDLTDFIMLDFITKYEKKNGEIKPMPKK